MHSHLSLSIIRRTFSDILKEFFHNHICFEIEQPISSHPFLVLVTCECLEKRALYTESASVDQVVRHTHRSLSFIPETFHKA